MAYAKAHRTSATLILLALALQGCATAPNVEIDKSAAAQTRRIALLAIPEPHGVVVMNMGSAVGALGIVGGLIQGSTDADHSKAFGNALIDRKTSLAAPLTAAIVESLKADGYDVSIVRDQRPKLAADGKSDDYSGVHVDADAILSVWSGIMGYVSPGNTLYYEPWVMVKVRLLDARTKKDMYYKTFMAGFKMPITDAVFIEADKKYRYRSFDKLMAKVDEAASGLLDCEKAVATRVGADLSTR